MNLIVKKENTEEIVFFRTHWEKDPGFKCRSENCVYMVFPSHDLLAESVFQDSGKYLNNVFIDQ